MRKYGTAAAVLLLALGLTGCTGGRGLFTKTYTIGKQISSGQLMTVVTEYGELHREGEKRFLVSEGKRVELDVPHWNMLVQRLEGKTACPLTDPEASGVVQVAWSDRKELYGIVLSEAEYRDLCDAMNRAMHHSGTFDPFNLKEVSLHTSGGMNGGFRELVLKKEHGLWTVAEAVRETHNSQERRTSAVTDATAITAIRGLLETMDWVGFKDLPPSEMQALDGGTTTLSFVFEPTGTWHLHTTQALNMEAWQLLGEIREILQEAAGGIA